MSQDSDAGQPTAGSDTILSVSNITRTFGGLVAVDDVSFDISQGESVGLIGPNGAGKTTLFNVINGYLEPDNGTVELNGVDVTNEEPHVHTRHGMSRTFQLVKPFENMTVLENVMVGGFFETRDRNEAARRAEAQLERLDLSYLRDVDAENISVIEKKQMELARALATEPELLLLDEIMAGLNEEEIEELLGLLQQINDEGVTLITIEHVMEAVMSISERIIVLNEGNVIADDRPEAVAQNDLVIDAYLGSEYRKEGSSDA
jgi:branched-chain amino acid transport system ATP-binding protein